VNDSLWTFLFEIANFVGLAAVLAWLFFKPVRKALEDQRAASKRKDEEAAQKLADAARLRQDIESQHQTLATELAAMRTKVRESAKQDAAQIVDEARAQVERERAALKREALHIEKAQTAKIALAVATVTHHTVKRFLQQMEGPELELTLVKAACRELQALSNDSLAPVGVESATALDEVSRQLIDTSLGAAAKSADFQVVPELEGGLRVSTAHGIIDASIIGLANFAEQSLSVDMESMIREESESV
jgi:F0F1-type ATP synthase membrane subunit b/b'